MFGLLGYSLGRIDSLQHFYNSELISIERKSRKGMKENRLPYLIDVYFSMLTSDNEEERKRGSFESLKTYMDKHIKVLNVKEEGIKKHIEFETISTEAEEKITNMNVKKNSLEYQMYAEMPIIHSHNTLTMLITRFEEFIANFIRELFEMYPEKYLNNQSIKFSEIVDIGTEEVRNKIIEREINEMMKASYSDWFKLFSSHNMDMKKCESELRILKEIYARRNIAVHNSGFVNEIYLSIVDDSSYQIGDALPIDEKYLSIAFNTIKKIIFVVIYEAGRFIKREEIKDFQSDIFNQAFEELSKENYEVSRKIYDILKDNKIYDDKMKLMSKINYWISVKEIDGIESIRKDITDFDTSAYASMFTLAKHILLDQYDIATQVVEYMFDRGDIRFIELNTWPLFKRYRETVHYESFKSLHSDNLSVATVEPSSENAVVKSSIKGELDEVQKG